MYFDACIVVKVKNGTISRPTSNNPSEQEITRRVKVAVPEIGWSNARKQEAYNLALVGTDTLPHGYHWAVYSIFGVGNPEEITKIMVERRLREAGLLGCGGNVQMKEDLH